MFADDILFTVRQSDDAQTAGRNGYALAERTELKHAISSATHSKVGHFLTLPFLLNNVANDIHLHNTGVYPRIAGPPVS